MRRTLTLGLKSYRQMVMRQPLPGFYYTYTHKGFWRQRTPRPLYWKAEVVQGFGHGSRDLVS